jgi:predicted nucleic acid-binding protein
MMFWDSSAVVPYLAPEAISREITEILDGDRSPVVWWASPIECVSALERGRREGRLSAEACRAARERLADLLETCDVVQAHPLVRTTAERLLAAHPLRAGDALQLAAALAAVENDPGGESLVTLDARLRDAATREGFVVLPRPPGQPARRRR